MCLFLLALAASSLPSSSLSSSVSVAISQKQKYPKQQRKNKKCFVCTSQDNAQTIDSATDEHKEEKKPIQHFFSKLTVGTFLHIRDNPMLIKRKMCARIRTQILHVFSFVRSPTGHSREREKNDGT